MKLKKTERPLIRALTDAAERLGDLDTAISDVLAGRDAEVPRNVRENAATVLDALGALAPDVQPSMGGGCWNHNVDRTPANLARLIRSGCLVDELGYLADGFRRLAREEEPIEPTERHLLVAETYRSLLQGVKNGGGHSIRSTPGVKACVDAQLLETDELDLATLTPLGQLALAIVNARKK